MKNHKTTLFALAILALGLLSGCATRSGPPASVQYDKAVSPYHVVKKGDSIASIAKKYGMDKRELIRINGLESPYRIVKGQRLLVRAHKEREAEDNYEDDTERPATEEVGNVPESDGVSIKPLAPASGIAGEALHRGSSVSSDGRKNPEVDDEGESVGDEGQDSQNGRRFDEDNIDAAEGRSMARNMPKAPAASGFIMPAQGTIIRDFNPSGKGGPQNDGINIAAARGSPVVAANNGVVAKVTSQPRGYGNVVLVKHDKNLISVYGHLEKVTVKEGDIVSAGQKLGTIGQEGNVTKPQLHFQLREKTKIIDPKTYLPN